MTRDPAIISPYDMLFMHAYPYYTPLYPVVWLTYDAISIHNPGQMVNDTTLCALAVLDMDGTSRHALCFGFSLLIN